MTVTPGTRFGSYEISALLGAGGMGEVYRARDARLGRDVALKVLAPRLAGNQEAVARFEQEARSASALSHPHILHIYDIGTTDFASESVRYIVMELVDGDTLTARMQTAELRDVLEWLAQVADGLAKAHAAGIVHRDLKPDNVMVSTDGYAKILDFGLAKLIEPVTPIDPDAATMVGAGPVHSTPGVVLGTACYMSPEQAHGQPTDARTDVFALGCMIYEAAAHRRAFAGKSLVDTLHKVIYAEPDYTGLDERLARIARKCLAKNPADRYQSVRDVARELREIASGSATTTKTVAVKNDEGETIAVLPFDDFSPGRDNEYFADGVTEEITSDLSKIRSLRVISRASVRKYRGDEKDIARVASELGVAYVIDGSVRRAGSQLRVTAQLIDARSGTQLWSEKYSGTVDEVFDIQESVARSVVARLQIELTSGENELLAARPISNIEVYDWYLRARRNLARFDEEGLTAAIREIEKGRAIAPSNVALLSLEGYVYFQYFNLGLRPDPAYLDRAAAIARQIEEKEPGSPHAHRLFGFVATQRQDMHGALEHLGKVLESDPNDVDALMWMCFLGSFVGHDATAETERLAAIDPLSPTTFAACAAPVLFNGDPDAGLPLMAKTAEALGSIFSFVHLQMTAAYGRLDDVRRRLPELEARRDDDPFFAPLSIVVARAATGDHAGAREALTNELLQMARLDYQYSSWIAEIYAQLGEIDLALEWLEHSVSRGYTPWPFLSMHDRLLDPLRGDPRFTALLDRARIEWESYQ